MSSKIEVSREHLEAWAERFSKAQMFKESSEVRRILALKTSSASEVAHLTEGLVKGSVSSEAYDKELRAILAAPAVERQPVCAHEWTDDGQFMLICTKCGTQENHDPKWRDMETAPKDGTLVRLLVEFEDHSTEDDTEAPTIGANNFDNDEQDEWLFAGWCWTHDHWTQGKGTPIGWLPMIDTAPPELAELQATIAQQAAEIERLKGGQGEQFDMAVSALNDIVKVSRMGEKPFEIATLAIGEMSAIASQPAPVSVDLSELREYHAKAISNLKSYADDAGLRDSDTKQYTKRAAFHEEMVTLIDKVKELNQ